MLPFFKMEGKMTIIEAITRLDALKPNSYTQMDKILWLSNLDWNIKAGIIDTHEGGSDIVFNGYDQTTPIDTKLLVSAPYDEMYIKWLEAQIDYNNAEYGKYGNSITTYNNIYSAFERDYNRHHMPIEHKLKIF
jgi:hypothetical protein